MDRPNRPNIVGGIMSNKPVASKKTEVKTKNRKADVKFINIQLKDDVADRIEDRAKEFGLTVSGYVRMLISKDLNS